MSSYFAVRSHRSATDTRRTWPEWAVWATIALAVSLLALTVPVGQNIWRGQRLNKEERLRSHLREIRVAIGAFVEDTGYYPVTLDDLNRAMSNAPTMGVDDLGEQMPLISKGYRGPYLTRKDRSRHVTFDFHQGQMPANPFARRTKTPDVATHWSYANGRVHPTVPPRGTTLDGVPFQEL